MNLLSNVAALGALATLAACSSSSSSKDRPTPPFEGLFAVDHLIQPGEVHFAHLWQVTKGGQNAEGYFDAGADRIVFQRTDDALACDRIYVTDAGARSDFGSFRPVSAGKGVTTCSFFMPGGREVLFASTQGSHQTCPPPVDRSDGYVWPVHPEYDIYAHDLESGAERKLVDSWGYDAEATLSPLGDRIVFTSGRTGDLELWTCNVDGTDQRQVTRELGYDGGAFFSHDGTKLVFRATRFTEDGVGTTEKYVELLGKHKIRPHLLDLYVCNVDGSDRRRVTDLGGASWAPYFFPGDWRIIFSSNHHDPSTPKVEFDLFAIDADGGNVERITTYQGFDAFPMFSKDGKWLVFASNRGGTVAGETNLFVAKWK